MFCKLDEWQFDSFELQRLSDGRPLSCLAFHLMKKMDIIKHFHLDEAKLARWGRQEGISRGEGGRAAGNGPPWRNKAGQVEARVYMGGPGSEGR